MIISRGCLFLPLSFELCVTASTAREPVKMLGHECAFLTSWTLPLYCGDFAVLVDFVSLVRLCHLFSFLLL